jgi:hypothetical protein
LEQDIAEHAKQTRTLFETFMCKGMVCHVEVPQPPHQAGGWKKLLKATILSAATAGMELQHRASARYRIRDAPFQAG